MSGGRRERWCPPEKKEKMKNEQFLALDNFRKEFKEKIEEWNQRIPNLMELQKNAAKQAGTPEYPFETPIVYNRALDEILPADEIKLFVIGDNPGKDEQLLKNNKYLVGQAGKLGEGFFRKNPELGIDFRKNVIILNKTPVHSAKTAQLKNIAKCGGKSVVDLIEESQIWMARKTAELARVLNAKIWLVGYSELKDKGIFVKYRDELRKFADWECVFVFQHFSMNRFSIDLKNFMENAENKNLSLGAALEKLGILHKNEIFKQG